jgi:hypothetical protein
MSSRFLILGAALLLIALAGCVPEHERGNRRHVTAASAQRRAYLAERGVDNDAYYQASMDPYYVSGEYDGSHHYGYGGRLSGYRWGDRYSDYRTLGYKPALRVYSRSVSRTPVRASNSRVYLHSRRGKRTHRSHP